MSKKIKIKESSIEEDIRRLITEELEEAFLGGVGGAFSRAKKATSQRIFGKDRGKGLSPMGEPEEQPDNALARLGKKLGLSKDWAQIAQAIDPSEAEKLDGQYKEAPPPVSKLGTGFFPKLGDYYALVTKQGKKGIAKILGYGIGLADSPEPTLYIDAKGAGWRYKRTFGAATMERYLKGKFASEEEAEKALVATAQTQIAEMVKKRLEILKDK